MNLPKIGFGTYKLSKPIAYTMVLNALNIGYRLIDTAELYCNETMVSKALQETDIPRDEIFLCTKVSTRYHGNIEKSVRKRLRIFDYIDLLLLHWASTDHVEGWRILCKLQEENPDKIKHIGICNVSKNTLEDIMRSGKKPDAIQNEIHPFCYDKELYDYCRDKGIKIISHSCMVFGKALEYDEIKQIAEEHRCTAAQILIRWAQEYADTVLTRCDDIEYLKENIEVDIGYIDIETDRKESKYPIK